MLPMLLVTLAACPRSAQNDGSAVQSAPPALVRAPSPTPTDPSTLPLPECPSRRRWVEFVSDDPPLRFEVPALAEASSRVKKLTREEGDWSGVGYHGGGGCRIGDWQFAGEHFGGASKDLSNATHREIAFDFRWFMRNGKTYIDQGGSKQFVYSVRPLDFLTVNGARAVLFRASSMRPFFLEGAPEERDDEVVAVINFPSGYDDDFASLTIHLTARASIDQLRRAVRSLELTKR